MISIPEYFMGGAPNFQVIGGILDQVLRHPFDGQEVVLRGLDSREREESARELISLIHKAGTDRPNPEVKKGRGCGNVDCDLFGNHKRIARYPL